MTCPKCQAPMRQYERAGVTIDQCSECRGIFLDRGELERLVDAEDNYHGQGGRSHGGVPSAPPAPGGYPAQQPGYPPQSPGYPAQGYPPASGGYGAPAYGSHGPARGGYSTHGTGHGAYGHHGHRRHKGHRRNKSLFDDLFG